MPNLMISINDEQYTFVKRAQKQGLKPSKVFQNAINRIISAIEKGSDVATAELEEKMLKYKELVQKQSEFMQLRGLYDDWVVYKETGKNKLGGVSLTE